MSLSMNPAQEFAFVPVLLQHGILPASTELDHATGIDTNSPTR